MNRRTLLLLAALTAMGCSRSTASNQLKTLSVDEVSARIALGDGKTFVYDNNPRERFDKSHVPGARWLDFRSVKASDLPQDRSATLVFYCANEL
jgi:3-mercaptopyruvate sulfurtransferase SseA